MPIIKSAKKRVKQANKATIRNAKTKRSLRESLKNFIKTPSADIFNEAQSNLDKAAKKGLVHKNKVARKKRQLAAAAKKAGIKTVGTTKKTAKTTAAKKPAVKTATKTTTKSVAKKPTTKSATKKPTAKTSPKTTTKKTEIKK